MLDMHSMPWVIFKLQEQFFAVSSHYVREMIATPSITNIPNTPAHYLGTILLRDTTIPAYDLRQRLDMKPIAEESQELIDLLIQREKDHKNWLKELELSVHEKREFTLATNPHLCAFGKWYDTFTTDNPTLKFYLSKFDAPHKSIHSIAVTVKKLEIQGNHSEALEIIETTRNRELSEMISLFEKTRAYIVQQNQSISVVIEKGKHQVAVSVDSVQTVERLPKDSIEDSPQTFENDTDKYLLGISKENSHNALIQLIDGDWLFE